MKITVEYLKQRHAYWIEKLDRAGICEADKFNKVEIIVRKHCRSYEGLFHRKWVKVNVRRRVRDRIIIYQQPVEMSVKDIDDTLVHEMIHQYIIQNNLPDTSTHGNLFRDFMQRINAAFPDELGISIIGKELHVMKGPGTKTHKLILVWMKNGECWCCKIMTSRFPLFINYMKRITSSPETNIKDYLFCESNDMYFDDLRECRKYLHGIPMSLPELRDLCKECNIKRI